MKHRHKYEPISHPNITSELKEIGILSAEIRKCATCQKEVTFLQTRKGKWLPLFVASESDEKDILLA